MIVAYDRCNNFIVQATELLRNLWQFKTAVFLHWCLMRAVALLMVPRTRSPRPSDEVAPRRHCAGAGRPPPRFVPRDKKFEVSGDSGSDPVLRQTLYSPRERRGNGKKYRLGKSRLKVRLHGRFCITNGEKHNGQVEQAWSKPEIFWKSVTSRNLLFSLNTGYFPFVDC